MFNFYRSKEKVTAYQLRGMPSKLWKAFKIKCQEEDIPTMQTAILNFIEQFNEGKIDYKP